MTTEEEFPGKLKIGKQGFFQPGILLQTWFWVQDQKETTSTFRVRRAEVHIKGDIIPKLVTYKLMFDPAKLLRPQTTQHNVVGSDGVETGETVGVPTLQGDPSILQDVYVTFMSEYADVSIGQFKVPLSWEGYNSASKVLFPERALASRRYGDLRDLGLRVEKKIGDYFGYIFGIYNGEGQGRPDSNNQKDFTLRLEAYPIKGVTLAAVGYTGVGERDEVETKDRVEGDLRVELGDALLQAEYLHGWDGPTNETRREGHGYYIAGGYTFFDRLQPIARFGYLDTDIDSDQAEQTSYEFGFNYYLQEYEARLQATYGIFDRDLVPGKEDLLHEFILAAQVSF